MDAALYILAILGCGEGDAPCQQVRVAETRYESRAACMAATEEAVMRNSDLEFPIVVAQCSAAGSQAEPLTPAEVDRPRPASAPARPSRGSAGA